MQKFVQVRLFLTLSPLMHTRRNSFILFITQEDCE